MSDDGPPLIRPVPRRPFDLSLTTPTPPSEDSSPPTPAPARDANIARFLQPTPEPANSSLSRPQSFMNLTSSTLFGIYSPTTSSSRDRVFADRDELDTPWGTGAQTPVKRPGIDDATFDFLKDRSHQIRRRSSIRSQAPPTPVKTSPSSGALVLRGLLLFVLGVGYGVLVTSRFNGDSDSQTSSTSYNWLHLSFWGLAGVALGALFPWFDRVWEDSFGEKEDEAVVENTPTNDDDPSNDWAIAIRAIGAFVGIVFAIRKVAWASTLQVSLTLAMVNPLLWWLIDRSKPGFFLSAAVGLTGSIILLGVNPDMMPAPAHAPFRHLVNSTTASQDEAVPILGGFAHQDTLETGMWMLSVLFCSCVCFGNIGRRLTLGPSATAKGRWAGVR
ncbi:insulin-induced 2 [Fusarium longipes]|uniref:Insulin-induced 2 n=1 Tax=Fusarium longipes TaxID=694270 RepID=A0A395T880_9HYPO|nr:insulin-induced 2 [Fusarium longipes]